VIAPSPNPSASTVDAGEFGTWVEAMTAMLRGGPGLDVPCGACVGCCSSSWPIALRAEDAEIAAALPPALLIDPPGAPEGVRYMGYRSDGTCPMLEAGRCSVYARRPATCRDFDCRLFAATGLPSAGRGKPLIDARIAAWRFRYATPEEAATHVAMRAATRFIVGRARTVPGIRWPDSPVSVAGLAFKSWRVFLDPEAGELDARLLADRILEAARAFDASH
jgi:Fe-S-cluster containining protein